MALKDIKAKIKSTERTHKVTRAMEAVSAVKMRKTQSGALKGRPYARAAVSILARLAGSAGFANHPLARVSSSIPLGVGKRALVVITSDKGLAGALNSGVLKVASEALLRSYFADATTGKQGSAGRTPDDTIIFAIGKKGEEFFKRRGYHIKRAFENKADDVELSVMEELAREISAGFVAGEYQEVQAVYSNFKSTFEQAPTLRKLLPLSLEALESLLAGIVPDKGKFSELRKFEPPPAYTIESADDVLDTFVPRLVAVALYHMLLESKASEHSARMVAMKNASDKSEEVAHDLTRLYNKIRQAAITREVSEIVSGREALAT